jgi:hypothetical protein
VTWWYVSTEQMTFAVRIEDGRITEAPPIARRFVGQSAKRLGSWLRQQGGFRAERLMTIPLIFLGLIFTGAARADRQVIYGVNDSNFARQWSLMAPRIAPLGPIQVGLWVRYSCGAADSDSWLVRGLPADLGQVPASQPAMVQLLGATSCSPRSNAQRHAYALAARALVLRYRNIRELQVWNEPDLAFWQGTVGDYVKLLAATHDALRGTGVKLLGPGFSPNGLLDEANAQMGVDSFAAAVRVFYRTHRHYRRSLLDGFAYHPYWGFDRKTTSSVARTLNRLWQGLPQPSPKRGLRFWWTETGAESAINAAPATEFGPGNGYSGTANYWPPYLHLIGDTTFQANRVATLALKARANPLVAADFNFELSDDPNLARWQSGLYYVGGKPKPAFAAFRSAIG